MITLAVDPGVHSCGVAIFDGSALTRALLLSPAEITPALVKPDHVVIELPQIYARTKSKGDPNDLIQVALVVGALRERFDGADLVRPREWKGTIKKAPHHERILSKLSEREKKILPNLPASKIHNVYDAIGIGQFFLKKSLRHPKR